MIVTEQTLLVIRTMKEIDNLNNGVRTNEIYYKCGLNTRKIRGVLAALLYQGFVENTKEENPIYKFTERGLEEDFQLKKPIKLTKVSDKIFAYIRKQEEIDFDSILNETNLIKEALELQLELLEKKNKIQHFVKKDKVYYREKI